MARKPNSIRNSAQAADDFINGKTAQEAAPVDEVKPTETPQEAEPKTAPAEPASEPKPEPVEPRTDGELEKVRQQLAVLQGKYNAEVPRLSSENKELRSQVARLELEKQNAQSLASQAQPAGNSSSPSIDAIRREYGDEMGDYARAQQEHAHAQQEQVNRLTQTVESLRAEINGRLEKTEQTVTETVSQTRNEKFAALLHSKGLDLQQMNRDQDFVQWLDELDPYSGIRRGDLMNSAYKSDELQRAAMFFIDYASSKKTASPKPSAPATPPRVPPVTAQSTAPDGSAVPVDSGPMQPHEITEFYAKKRKGLLTPEEIAAGESRIYRRR